MAGKARVHELAKELGVTSKDLLARLSEQGEFVKSASSTVEAPVARRLREAFGGAQAAPVAPPVKKAAPAKAAAAPAAPPVAKPVAPAPAAPVAPVAPPAAPAPVEVASAPASPVAEPGPLPGPAAPKPALPRQPRVGNNPFSSAQPVELSLIHI